MGFWPASPCGLSLKLYPLVLLWFSSTQLPSQRRSHFSHMSFSLRKLCPSQNQIPSWPWLGFTRPRSLVRSPRDLRGYPRRGMKTSFRDAAPHFSSSPLGTGGWVLSPSGRPEMCSPALTPQAVFCVDPSSFAVQFL